MRPGTIYYLAQRSPRRNHQFQRDDAPPYAASRGRHARPPRSDRHRPGLLAVTRRVLAMLNGTSQPA